MVVKRRKKSRKMRGSRTHGFGLVHRGTGNKGGKGMAGTGKKAQSKKPMVWHERYLGKFGFKPKNTFEYNAVNLGELDENAKKLFDAKLAEHKEGFYVIDIAKLGYTKLLGGGKVKNKLKIIAKKASESAAEKLKKHGGVLELKA